MRSFRFKKHRMENVKIKVLVIPDDQQPIIPPGGKFDLPPPAPLPKPTLPRLLVRKITRPPHAGRVEPFFGQD